MTQKPRCVWRFGDDCVCPELGGQASEDRCAVCPSYLGRARGMGDIVHSISKRTGIAKAVERLAGGPCSGCAQRRAALNARLPFADT